MAVLSDAHEMSTEDIVSNVLASLHHKLRQRCDEDQIVKIFEDAGAYSAIDLHDLLDSVHGGATIAKLEAEGAAPTTFMVRLQKALAELRTESALAVSATPSPALLLNPEQRTRVLIIVCNPRQTPLASAGKEALAAAEIWGDDNVVIVGVQRGVVQDKLPDLIAEHKPNVLHFIGHTIPNDGEQQCRLVLLDEDGNAMPITAELFSRTLGTLAARESLQVVILSACDGDEPAVALSDMGLYTFCFDSLAQDRFCAAFTQKVHAYIASHVQTESLVATLAPAFESAVLFFDGHPKLKLVDPQADGLPRWEIDPRKEGGGTALLLRPRLASEKMPRVLPSLHDKYVAELVNTGYAKGSYAHATKVLLRYRYAFQFVPAEGHVVGLCGRPGVGTSTLATMLAHDPRVQSLNPDGIFWVDAKLGWDEERKRQLAREVSAGGTDELPVALKKKRCMVIVDGAMEPQQVLSILQATSGRQQTVLFTTTKSFQCFHDGGLHRDPNLVPEDFARYTAPLLNSVTVQPMHPGLANSLLNLHLPDTADAARTSLAEACECLPRGLMEAIDMIRRGRFDIVGATKYIKDTGALKRFFRPSLDRWEREWDSITWGAAIGTGATGTVYKVTCSAIPGVDLAAKVIRHDLDATEHRKFVKMLSVEVQALAQINHPNVVRMYGVSIDQPNKGLCVLMELHPKGSLRHILSDPARKAEILSSRQIQFRIAHGIVKGVQTRPHTTRRCTRWRCCRLYPTALSLLTSIVAGMAFLHERATPVLHHDCKSANVLIDDEWNAMLCDFGMATGVGMTSLSLVNTSSRNRSGTYLYSAPEALMPGDEFVFDTRCEVYTLGLIIWELLTAGLPYANASGPSDSFPQFVKKVVTDKQRPPPPTDDQLMDRAFLWDVAQRAWKQDPAERPTYVKLLGEFSSQAATFAHPGARDWSVVKPCVVRVGVFDTTTRKLLSVGSGSLVKRDGHDKCTGHVLTAAHVLLETMAGVPFPPLKGAVPTSGILYEPAAGVVVLIGVYEGDKLSSKWRYWADVKTPYVLLSQMQGKYLTDLAILQIRGTVAITPDVFMHSSPPDISVDTYTINSRTHTPPAFDSCLSIGDPSSVVSGDPLSCLGWPTPDGQTTIYVDDKHNLLSKEHGHLKSQAFLHKAMSGGPLLNHRMEIVGVNSYGPKDPSYGSLVDGTLEEPANYAGWGRMTDMLTPAHWGTP